VVLEPLLITLDYQQQLICSGSETVTDDSLKSLQMTFSVAVKLEFRCIIPALHE
jgi:hypothetical protein